MVVFESGSCPVPGHLKFAWQGQSAILADLLTTGDCCNVVPLFEQPCFVTPSQWIPCCACLNSDVIIKFTGANISIGTHPAGGISDYLTRCRMFTARSGGYLHSSVILPRMLPLFSRRIPAAHNYHLGFVQYL